MFNFFRSGEKAKKYFLSGLLVLVSLSMLTYLIPSYGTSSGADDQVVAEIGKEKLTLQEVKKSVDAAIRGRNLPQEFIPHYIPEVVRNIVNERALVYQAKRMGFEVSEAEIAAGIKSILPQLFPDGKFVGKETYAAFLAQQNLSIEEFESNMQRQLLRERLRRVVLEGTVVSPQEIEQEYHRKHDKVAVEYVKLSPDKFRNEVKVTPEEVKAYFTAHQTSYTIPEKHSLGILVINQAKLEQAINPSDTELEAEYNRNKDQFRMPERVKARHILLTTTGKTKDEEAAVKAKAESLLKQIRGGADFAKLARENSQDTGTAPKGGEIDWITRGQALPEFDKSAFSLKPGETSDLVKTQLGYHIIQVEEHENARLKPFSEVKADLAANYKKAKVSNEVQALTDKAQAALKKDPLHPDQVAASLGIDFAKAENVSPGDPLPIVGVDKDFEDTIAGLKAGEASQPVALKGNRIAMASVTLVTPAHPATFAEVENQVRETVSRDKMNQLTTQKAQELADKVKSMNGDLQKAAKALGFEVKTVNEVTRAGAVEGLGSSGYISDAFTKPDGTILGPINIPGQAAIVKVISHTTADASGLAGVRDSIREELKGKKAGERDKLFEAGLVDALTRSGKVKIHQDVISRLEANYRG